MDASSSANTHAHAVDGLGRRLRRWAIHRLLRLFMLCYAAALRIAAWLGRSRRPRRQDGYDILLTGTFYADNWIRAHVVPLAMSRSTARVRLVCTSPIAPIEHVAFVRPPAWLVRAAGGVGARLAMFAWVALRDRPDIVGGFHLLLNGLTAALLARLVGARSMYFCVGGPAEVLGGGIWSENRLFERLETPDAVIERRLLDAVGSCDLVVTMGHRAVEFFRRHGVAATLRVASGGIDAERFSPSAGPRPIDCILVARLTPIKRVDLFVQAIGRIAEAVPAVTAVVVGEGPLRPRLEEMARSLGIQRHVSFAGRQADVERWLRQAKVFVLTSDSEGLPLSIMEAMLAGLPVVASNVGDIPELIDDGVNGFLVDEREPSAFAERVVELLTDERRRVQFAAAARRAAERYELGAAGRLWDGILALPHLSGRPAGVPAVSSPATPPRTFGDK